MNDADFFQNEIEKIRLNSDNEKCFDCESENPFWVSLNHGIFLCLKCSGSHREYLSKFSIIKSTTIDSWDENSINYMKTGGNKKLKNFFDGYNILKDNNDPLFKYKTKAANYYRNLLRNLVEGGSLIEPPELNEGNILMYLEKKEKKEGGWASLGFSYFKNVQDLIGQGISKVNEKINESHLKENIAIVGGQVFEKSRELGLKSKEIGSELILKTKDLGGEVVHKSFEYGNIISEKTKSIGNQVFEKTKESYENVSKNISTVYENITSKEKKIEYEEMKEISPLKEEKIINEHKE